MRFFYLLMAAGWRTLLIGLLLPALARAQAPAWTAVTAGSSLQTNGTSTTKGTAVNAAGEVLVAGYFTGTVAFGGTVLSSRGGTDLFVAKYLPATGTWAWALSSGGTGSDGCSGIAVSGTSVYVTGFATNNRANASDVTFGGTAGGAAPVAQYGVSATATPDLFVARFTDNGTSAAFNWSQVAGGGSGDEGTGIAVSGTSVYVTGYLSNDLANSLGVLFGGSGTTAGTAAQYGAGRLGSFDIVVAKYTDNGTSAAFNWSQVGGGIGSDRSYGIAVSGSSLYVTGYISNDPSNLFEVVFGGAGTLPGTRLQYGAGNVNTSCLVVAKYTDNGATGTFGWSQIAGGIGGTLGAGIAASGSSVYVTGYLANSQANATGIVFGGSGTTPGTVPQAGATTTGSQDLLLAKYTDNGSTATFRWCQVGGGTQYDYGYAVAVSGSAVYVTGYLYNDLANSTAAVFGGGGTTPGTATQRGASTTSDLDVVVARYTDNGPSATLNWTQVAGGTGVDQGYGLAVSGSTVYVGGVVGSGTRVSFGAAGGPLLQGTIGNRAVLGQLTDTGTAGTWQAVASTSNGGTSYTRASAIDAAGNVFVTGNFTGQATFGNTVLISTGSDDLFVAKYVPGTNTWAWAASGGGTAPDAGKGIAVSTTAGVTSVYVSGYFFNDAANSRAVAFGGTGAAAGTVLQSGTASSTSNDLLVAKYIDNGTSAALAWTQVAGGAGSDVGEALAVSTTAGVTSVYVTGYIFNNTSNANAVVFGGAGLTPGTVPQYGASATVTTDIVLAKYLDNGTSASFSWSQVAGGRETDTAGGVAVSGSSVYISGGISNSTTNANAVVFGGTGPTAGTAPQYGASPLISTDLFIAKYTDNGPSATFNWSQVAGGTGIDAGEDIAVRTAAGVTSVYVTGTISNNTLNANAVVFGGAGTTAGTVPQAGATSTASLDLVLAKYTDNGATAAFGWSQVGGGTGSDSGLTVAVRDNTTAVYVSGYLTNSTTNANGVVFGATGTTVGTVPQPGASPTASFDVAVAKFADNGSTATFSWAQVAGGTGADASWGMALGNGSVYVVGYVVPAAAFGSLTLNNPSGASVNFLGQLPDPTLLAVNSPRLTAPAGSLRLYPNPARTAFTLLGSTPQAPVQVLDMQGRRVATATADALGTTALRLPPGLAAGVYVVRAGGSALRLVVE